MHVYRVGHQRSFIRQAATGRRRQTFETAGQLILTPAIATVMTILYVIGVVAIIGGLAMIAEAILRVRHGPGGWLVRSGEIVVALAAIYGIGLFLAFGLVNFVTNF